MATPLFLQNTASRLVVYLENTDSTPASTLTFSDISCSLKKTSGVFIPFTLTALNFTNLGAGLYEVTLAIGDVNTLGSIYMFFSGASILSRLANAEVVTATTLATAPTPSAVPDTSSVFGTILDPVGEPKAGVSISFHLLAKPAIMSPGYLLTSSFVPTTTDSAGLFTVDLITGAQYEVSIPDADYKRVFVVPASATNIFDIP